jgi:flagellar biogenesis protein FliO
LGKRLRTPARQRHNLAIKPFVHIEPFVQIEPLAQNPGSVMLQQFLAVFLVLALLLAALWLLRRKGSAAVSPGLWRPLGGKAGAKQMLVIERVALTAQHSLHLVAVDGRRIVVGVSPSGCSPIAMLPGPEAERGPGQL